MYGVVGVRVVLAVHDGQIEVACRRAPVFEARAVQAGSNLDVPPSSRSSFGRGFVGFSLLDAAPVQDFENSSDHDQREDTDAADGAYDDCVVVHARILSKRCHDARNERAHHQDAQDEHHVKKQRQPYADVTQHPLDVLFPLFTQRCPHEAVHCCP